MRRCYCKPRPYHGPITMHEVMEEDDRYFREVIEPQIKSGKLKRVSVDFKEIFGDYCKRNDIETKPKKEEKNILQKMLSFFA